MQSREIFPTTFRFFEGIKRLATNPRLHEGCVIEIDGIRAAREGIMLRRQNSPTDGRKPMSTG